MPLILCDLFYHAFYTCNSCVIQIEDNESLLFTFFTKSQMGPDGEWLSTKAEKIAVSSAILVFIKYG